MPARMPAALNSFALWLALMIGLTVVNYGYPIAQLVALKETIVPAVYVGAQPMSDAAALLAPQSLVHRERRRDRRARGACRPGRLRSGCRWRSPTSSSSGMWDAICSAAGVPRASLAGATSIQPDFKTSTVVMTSEMLTRHEPGIDRTRRHAGAALRDLPRAAGRQRRQFANLAGQYAAVIYKEMIDFKTGARVNAVMSSVRGQSQGPGYARSRRLLCLSAAGARRTSSMPAMPAPRIVIDGAPMRDIAPCGSCHGDLDNKAGSPWLGGQSAVYIKAQLQAFAAGARRNDISQQMRNIARQMTRGGDRRGRRAITKRSRERGLPCRH